MSDIIQIKVLDEPAQQLLNELHNRMVNLRPVMRMFSETMMAAVEDNFEAEGRPTKWPQLHPGTIEARKKRGYWPGKILQCTGQLLASIHPEYNDTEAVVGTNKNYAPIQHFGGQTKAHVIRPRKGKALAFKGKDGKMLFRRSVRHPGSKIPARQFLMLTDGEVRGLLDLLVNYIFRPAS